MLLSNYKGFGPTATSFKSSELHNNHRMKFLGVNSIAYFLYIR